MDDQQLEAAKRMAESVMNAIGQDPAADDILVVMVALGISLGTHARTSKQPATVMSIASKVADAIVSGEALD